MFFSSIVVIFYLTNVGAMLGSGMVCGAALICVHAGLRTPEQVIVPEASFGDHEFVGFREETPYRFSRVHVPFKKAATWRHSFSKTSTQSVLDVLGVPCCLHPTNNMWLNSTWEKGHVFPIEICVFIGEHLKSNASVLFPAHMFISGEIQGELEQNHLWKLFSWKARVYASQ